MTCTNKWGATFAGVKTILDPPLYGRTTSQIALDEFDGDCVDIDRVEAGLRVLLKANPQGLRLG